MINWLILEILRKSTKQNDNPLKWYRYHGIRNKNARLLKSPLGRIAPQAKNFETPLTELRRRRKFLKPP